MKEGEFRSVRTRKQAIGFIHKRFDGKYFAMTVDYDNQTLWVIKDSEGDASRWIQEKAKR